MRCYSLSIVRCAVVVLMFGSIPVLAQQSDAIPTLKTEDVLTHGEPPSRFSAGARPGTTAGTTRISRLPTTDTTTTCAS